MCANRSYWVQGCTSQTTSGIRVHCFFSFTQMSNGWHEMMMILKVVCKMKWDAKGKMVILQLPR